MLVDLFHCVFCNSILLIDIPIYNLLVIAYIFADLFSISFNQSLATGNRFCFSQKVKISKIMLFILLSDIFWGFNDYAANPSQNTHISRVFVSLLCGLYHSLAYWVCFYLPLITSNVMTFEQIQISSSLIYVSISKVYILIGIFFPFSRPKS